MICPKCGHSNHEGVGECSKCFYKFRFGYGYKDPAKSDPWLFTRGLNNNHFGYKDVIITIGLILMCIAAIVPVLFVIYANIFIK